MSGAEAYRFADDGRFPNSALPLLVHRRALPPDPDAMERAFAAHGWSNAWRDGIFGFHHFHSTAHEVLGIAAGTVRVAFGGPLGREMTVRAGDVVVIPAGVAHCNRGQSADLLVAGAYPGARITTSAGALLPSTRRPCAPSPPCRCRAAIPCWAATAACAGFGCGPAILARCLPTTAESWAAAAERRRFP